MTRQLSMLAMVVAIGAWLDARPAAAQCNPVAQTGCGVGEKCTWINIDSFNGVGTIGCAADGTVTTAGACTYGPDGEDTGFDDCAAGHICIGSACEAICTVSPDPCGPTMACTNYAGLFTGSSPQLGACDFRCDPVDQRRSFDGAEACGSADVSAPDRGCYGVANGSFKCSLVPFPAADLTQGDTAYGPGSGAAFINGCAPGYGPLLRAANDASAPVICVAFCEPGPTSVEAPEHANGTVGSLHRCTDRGATAPDHECRYLWLFASEPPLHPDGIGFCMNPDNYVGNWDEDPSTPDSTFPRCTTLAEADNVGWGCSPYPGGAPDLGFPDAGVPDAGPVASPDAAVDPDAEVASGPDAGDPGVEDDGGGGCCRASGGGDGSVLLVLLGLAIMRRRRRLAWVLALGSLSLVACGDGTPTAPDAPVPEVADAEAPDAEPPDAEPPDAVPLAPVRVTVLSEDGPVAGVSVVFSDPSGAVVATELTDAQGQASEALVAGGAATIAMMRGAEHVAISWLGVAPGDDLVWRVSPPRPTDVGPISVMLPGAFGGAIRYRVQLGCHDLAVVGPALPAVGMITSDCIGATPTIAVVATALDAAGDPIAYAYDANVTPASGGATTSVALGAWQTATDPLTVTLTGGPAAATVVDFAHHDRIDGLDYRVARLGSSFTAGTATITGAYSQGGLADQLQYTMTIALGPGPADGTGFLIGGQPDAPAAVSYDLSEVLLPAMQGASAARVGGRVEVSYTSSNSFGGIADGGLVITSWEDGAEGHEWYALIPPDTASGFQLPAMPDALSDFRPTAASVFAEPTVIFAEADYLADYAALRTGVGFDLFGEAALDTVPLSGGLVRGTIAGATWRPGLGSCSTDLTCPGADANKVTLCGRLLDVETDAQLRAAVPNVQACGSGDETPDGPCQLAIEFYDALDFAGNPTGATPLAAEELRVDDCGRFVARNIPRPSLGFLAIGVDDAGGAPDDHRLTSAAFPVTSGLVRDDQPAYVLRTTTDADWATDVGFATTNTFVDRGVLLSIYKHGPTPVAGVTVTANGGTRAADDYYFTDTAPNLRQAATAAGSTQANGSALMLNSSLVEHSGQGAEPTGCVWPSDLGASIPGVLWVLPRVAETADGAACP